MNGARVESLDALAMFRVALIKFQESGVSALGDAESDVYATIRWLENDMISHWNAQLRSRQEAVAKAAEAVRQKTLFKDSTGRAASAVEEQKLLAKAQARFAEAEQKLAATKSWAKRLQKELVLYKGAMQRCQTMVTSDVPAAVNHLGSLIYALQEYFAAQAKGGEGAAAAQIDPALAAYFEGQAGPGSMKRAAPTGPDEPKKEESATEVTESTEKEKAPQP
jgi:hypothetical protein